MLKEDIYREYETNMGKGSRDQTDFRVLNAREVAPVEPELTEDEEFRLDAIYNQLKLH